MKIIKSNGKRKAAINRTTVRKIMTDLSGKLEGQTNEAIASYFGMHITLVGIAISEGARTYQDIYDFKQNVEKIEKEHKEKQVSKSTMVELVQDLEAIPVKCEELDYIIKEAREGAFHDYKNRKYACGKLGFVAVADAFSKRNPDLLIHLTPLVEAIKNGEYDETADDIDSMNMTNFIMKDSKMNTKQKDGLLNVLGLKKKSSGKSPYGKRYF